MAKKKAKILKMADAKCPSCKGKGSTVLASGGGIVMEMVCEDCKGTGKITPGKAKGGRHG